VAEPVQQGHLLLAVRAHRIAVGQAGNQLVDAGPQLVSEVRRRGPDERVDVGDARLVRHAETLLDGAAGERGIGRVVTMRRISAVDAILLATVLLWSLNYTVSKYVLNQGFRPLALSSLRYACAVGLIALVTYARERSLRIARRDLIVLLLPAAMLLLLNQCSFVYSLKYTTASTVALVLGTVPVFVGLLAWTFGIERPKIPFWMAAALSFAGVALVALGAGGVSGNLKGDLLAIVMSATWAGYSLLVLPLMQRYSPSRIVTVVMLTTSIPLLAIASPQIARQRFDFGGLTWLAFVYSFVAPLLVGQVLWFIAIDRVGASRGALFANLQPFGGVLFALLLLSEHLSRLEVAGGALIAAGILLERRAHAAALPQAPVE
jgi:drug/metabolite transporter (DMT)-like permease